MTTLGPGDDAPDFVAAGLDGHEFRLAESLRRGPVVLAIGKSSCGTCTLAFPYLERLRNAYPGSSWTLLGLLQDAPGPARTFARKLGLTFPLAVDRQPYQISEQYDPEATPTVFLIDRDGGIVRTIAGFGKQALNELSADLGRLIGQSPVVVAQSDDGKPSFRPG